ncbi:MAG TPA: phenylalanine--tRNA ligase subunit beta [Candidatus Syntrophosphaera thermopropionivorans]|nr:phenylalanine--tRNA ligase subunit beta [Candidatus Syntrophosphaera thermopropionivorans]
MIVSTRWLSKYIDLPETLEELVQTLTFTGIEVEAIQEISALPETLVTARILNSEKIPGTEHLQVCIIDYGKEPLQVVCGAPNCRSGLITAFAQVGSKLPEMEIKKTIIHSVESAGMLCSEKELGISDNHSGIIELPPETPVGIPINEIYELPDNILELEITPNRPDLLGYIGIARDLAASLNKRLKLPSINNYPGEEDSSLHLTLILQEPQKCPRYTARIIDGISVKESPLWLKNALIKSGLRPINNIVDITNYVMLETGQPLHAFDYHKLLPINQQESHPAIIVRRAKAAEEFIALDGNKYLLDEEDLVIADGQRPSALAGIIGGKDTAISNHTTTIVLESANFSPSTIRKSSLRHKISTDSSYRFERHLSPAYLEMVSNRALELIINVAGGRVCNELYDAYPVPQKPLFLAVRPSRFEELIGYKLDASLINNYLQSLGFQYILCGLWQKEPINEYKLLPQAMELDLETSDNQIFFENPQLALYFLVPSYRVDITREADIIEELARLDGFDKIPQKKLIHPIMDWHAHHIKRKIEDYFRQSGFYEMINPSFIDPIKLEYLGEDKAELEKRLIRIVNPQSSNQSAMRTTMLPQLLDNLLYNLNHSERNLKLMEMGKLYWKDGNKNCETLHLTALMTGLNNLDHWKVKNEPIDLYNVKGVVEGLLDQLSITIDETKNVHHPWLVESDNLAYFCNNHLCASFGRLKAKTAERFNIDIITLKQDIWVLDFEVNTLIELTRTNKIEFSPLPKFPAVIRDISFLINFSVPYADIVKSIKLVEPYLIQDVKIFDEYRGKGVPDGWHSISLHIILQDYEKTLTEERVGQVIDSVIKMLENTWQIKMR